MPTDSAKTLDSLLTAEIIGASSPQHMSHNANSITRFSWDNRATRSTERGAKKTRLIQQMPFIFDLFLFPSFFFSNVLPSTFLPLLESGCPFISGHQQGVHLVVWQSFYTWYPSWCEQTWVSGTLGGGSNPVLPVRGREGGGSLPKATSTSQSVPGGEQH